MKESSLAKKLIGTWNTKTIVGVAIGAALFGVLMNYGGIKVTTNTSLTTAYLVPAIVGAFFGPLPAGLAAGLGNVVADLLGGWGFWFDWSVGNFVAGYFAGLFTLFGANVEDGDLSVKDAIIYIVCCIIGVGLGFGIVTPYLTYAWYSSDLTITWVQATSAIISDASVLIIVGLPVLFAIAKRNKRGTNLSKED